MLELTELPLVATATIDKDDYVQEWECGRYNCSQCSEFVPEIDRDYLDMDGHEICGDCYEIHVEPYEIWDKDTNEFLGWREVEP